MNMNTDTEFQLKNNTVLNEDDLTLDEIQMKLFGSLSSAKTQEPTVVDPTVTNPDLMPSDSTMKMSYVRNYTAPAPAKLVLTKKVKMAAVSYAAVVLLLIVGITVCSFLVSNAYAGVQALKADYALQQEAITLYEEQIRLATESERIIEAGIAMGFTPINNTNSYTYTMVETREAQNFAIQGNWFDSFCDWLTNIFGG